MKVKLLLILFIILSWVLCFTINFCNASEWRDLNTEVNEKGYDHIIHPVVGAVGTALTYKLIPDEWKWSETKKRIVAFAVPVVIAGIKELTDKNPDATDILEYGLGSAFTITIIHFNF